MLGDRRACDESLRRLGTDHIDLYQFHLGGYDLAKADDVLAVFEELVAAGKVRAHFNVFGGNAEVLELCEQHGLASIVRGPLGMGLLTGKFDQNSTLPADDVRHGWNFRTGDQAESLRRLDAIRDVLTSDGRTLAQGALAWPWARSEAFIPIPGFKTVAQVEENAGALDHGPLTKTELAEVTTILQ
ncbi:aldo/keto reductase [Kribbella capetownensis]|uniref:aldo/keto reductase n=1 Tax=Kribbella capetownensis TaxID=1572659 RepID=UPI00192DB02B|nr:aldo/keto reductase [Kribbella capetownensis]